MAATLNKFVEIDKGYYTAQGHPLIAADVRIYGAAVLFSDFILE